MENSRKQLKTYSILVLVLAGFTFINMLGELLFGDINTAVIPEGSPENILLITKIVIIAVTVIILLPQIYIGVKGIKMAKNPNSSKAHIVWAIILFVISIVGIISPLLGIIKQEAVKDNVSELLNGIIDAVVFLDYTISAKKVLKEI